MQRFQISNRARARATNMAVSLFLYSACSMRPPVTPRAKTSFRNCLAWVPCREARHCFKDATLLGFSQSGVVHANPADDALLTEGDWLFGIAGNRRSFSMSKVPTQTLLRPTSSLLSRDPRTLCVELPHLHNFTHLQKHRAQTTAVAIGCMMAVFYTRLISSHLGSCPS